MRQTLPLVLILLLGATASLPAVALIDDAACAAAVEAAQQAVAAGEARASGRLFSALFDARRYADCEELGRRWLGARPDSSVLWANLSVTLGKQGRLPEALAAIDRALALDPDNLHARLVKPSWLWESGRHAEAEALFAAEPPPADGDPQAATYWGCAACYLASVGDEQRLRDAIAHALALGDEHRSFFRHDVVFDRYRAQPWFVALVGETLAPAR